MESRRKIYSLDKLIFLKSLNLRSRWTDCLHGCEQQLGRSLWTAVQPFRFWCELGVILKPLTEQGSGLCFKLEAAVKMPLRSFC